MCDMDFTISVALIFSVIAATGTVVTIISTFAKQHENEEQRRLDVEKNFVKLNVKLDGFCDDMRKMVGQVESEQRKSNDLLNRIVRLEERVNQLEKVN